MIDSGTFDMVHQLSKIVIQFSEIVFVAAIISSWSFAAKYGNGKTFLCGVVVFAPVATLILGGVLFLSQTYPVFGFDNLKNTTVTASIPRYDVDSEKGRIDVPCTLTTAGKSRSLHCTFVKVGYSQRWQLWESEKYDKAHPKEAALQKTLRRACDCS